MASVSPQKLRRVDRDGAKVFLFFARFGYAGPSYQFTINDRVLKTLATMLVMAHNKLGILTDSFQNVGKS